MFLYFSSINNNNTGWYTVAWAFLGLSDTLELFLKVFIYESETGAASHRFWMALNTKQMYEKVF